MKVLMFVRCAVSHRMRYPVMRYVFRKEAQDFVLTGEDGSELRIEDGHRKYTWLCGVSPGRVVRISESGRWTSAKDYARLYDRLSGKPVIQRVSRIQSRLTKREVLFRQFRKFTRKSQEAYVISRIWHQLDLDDVEMLTQQYVRRESGGHALTDAYFPQVGIHIEVMEDAHHKKVELDAIRKEEIVDVTGHKVYDVWPGRDENGEGSLDKLHETIDAIVSKIRSKREDKIRSGNWEPWDPEFKYSVERWRAAGEVSLENRAAFRLISDACNAFGHQYEGYQKGVGEQSYGCVNGTVVSEAVSQQGLAQ